MYAHRQIYDNVQATIAVPEQLQNHRIEVIFMQLDEVSMPQPIMGLGSLIASYFKDIPPATTPDEEFVLPEREYVQAVSFE